MDSPLTTTDKLDFFSLDPDELAQVLGGSGRARQAWASVRAGQDPDSPSGLSDKAAGLLTRRCRLRPARVDDKQVAADGTTKLLVALRDGGAVETVIIPAGKRTTVCLSTQVGCSRGCVFCESGKQGLTRNLSPAEIVFQISLAAQAAAISDLPPVSNAVFMGMGEPLDNLPALEKAINILTHPHGWRLAQRRMTVSTVGPSPKAIRKASALSCDLAWSLHSADDVKRKKLIPQARHGVSELRDAFAEVIVEKRAQLFVELVMIDGLNDSQADMDSLMGFLVGLKQNVRINLLPLNPSSADMRASPADRVSARKKQLQDEGFFCETRRPRGLEIQAACGQLAGN